MQLQDEARSRVDAARAQQRRELCKVSQKTTDDDGNELSAEQRLQLRIKFIADQYHAFATRGSLPSSSFLVVKIFT